MNEMTDKEMQEYFEDAQAECVTLEPDWCEGNPPE